MGFVKVNLKNVPITFFISALILVLLLNIIGRLLPPFVELCYVVILTIIVACCFALLFLLPIIFPNRSDKRYRVNYLIAYMTSLLTSWLLAIYSSSVQSFLMHLLSFLALLIFVLTSSLLPVMECYEKYVLSWRDLLIGLRLVVTTSERSVSYILGKLTFWFIFSMPASIIISYLLTEAHLINIRQIPFNTLVYLILNIIVVIAVFMETIFEFPKLFPRISKMLGRGFYVLATIIFIISAIYLYELLTSNNQKLLEYSPSTFYSAIALLSYIFFFIAMVASTTCRNEVATSV